MFHFLFHKKKKVLAIVFLLLSFGFNLAAQNFNFKFCSIEKDAELIAFTFTVCNNTGSNLTSYKFVFNWPGVSNVTVDNNLDVLQNGSSGVVELAKKTAHRL